MKRNSMAKLYIGDVGVITPPIERKPIPADTDLDSMSIREMFTLAIEHGIPVGDLIGKDHCYDHNGMIPLGDRLLPPGYSMAEDVVYCRNCWDYFRTKKKVQYD